MLASLFTVLSAAAAAPLFTLVTVSDGTSYHLQNIGVDTNGRFSLDGKSDLTLTIPSAVTYAGKSIGVSGGYPTVGQSKSETWELTSGIELTISGSNSFFVCPSTGNIAAGKSAPSDCSGAVPVRVYAFELPENVFGGKDL